MSQNNETPSTRFEVNDFPGLMLLEDPIDLPPGAAQDQVNLQSSQQGQAQVRLGMLPVSFDFQG